MDKKQQDILSEISEINKDIENNYPELKKYLKESRETLPQGAVDSVDLESLENHRDSLKVLVERYKKQH